MSNEERLNRANELMNEAMSLICDARLSETLGSLEESQAEVLTAHLRRAIDQAQAIRFVSVLN